MVMRGRPREHRTPVGFFFGGYDGWAQGAGKVSVRALVRGLAVCRWRELCLVGLGLGCLAQLSVGLVELSHLAG